MNPTEKVLTIPLPGLTTDAAIDLCTSYWHEGEGLYRGSVDKRHISFDTSFAVIDSIEAYFTNKMYEVDAEDFQNQVSDHHELEAFAKLVWLSNEYLHLGFREPLGIHYNPRLDINAIHSGNVRNQVLRLFHEGDVDCLYFNTGGEKFKWMETMEPVDIRSYKGDNNVDLALVADHGSLIPHLHHSGANDLTNVIETHEKIQCILNSDFKVYSNVLLPALEPWTVAHPKDANHKIRLPAGYTTSDKLRAIIFAMLGKSYIGGY